MSGGREARDESRRHLLGRERDEQRAAARRREHLEVRRRRARGSAPDHARPACSRREKRPLQVQAEHRGLASHRRLHRRDRGRASSPDVSVIRVGSKPVVPNLRCAAAIARIASAVGASLNSTSPPPLTCRSMKPGASQAPSGSAVQPARRQFRPRHDSRDPRALDHDGGVVDAASRRRRRSPPRRRDCTDALIGSVSPSAGDAADRHRCRGAAATCMQHLIEALDQADRIGVRMIRRAVSEEHAAGAGLPVENTAAPLRAQIRRAASRCPAAAASAGMNIRTG